MTEPASGQRAGRVVLLGVPDNATAILANALRRQVGDVAVLLEQPVPRGELVRRRLRRLGARTVVGQLAFLALIAPFLRRAAQHRAREICRQHELDEQTPPDVSTTFVSVNSPEARAALRQLQPDVVVINGTRIIGAETLAATRAPFINLHAGITPQYRGVHGAYWALADGRPDLAGATVHVVDTGIDTGPVLAQRLITVSPDDSYATYPLLQLAAGLPDLIAAVRTVLNGSTLVPVEVLDPVASSRLRSHPTAVQYLANRIIRKVR
ncbi:MAG: hypothetical protein JJD92_04330 [Frankiaceae bacterium]|nr:hypothetical protein [Frankiaceae bacterium]